MSDVDNIAHDENNAGHRSGFFFPGIFFRPSVVFRQIEQDATWRLPVSMAVSVRTARTFLLYNPSKTPLKIILTVAADGIPVILTVLLCSAVIFGSLVIAGAETTFKRVFSVLSHSYCVYTLLYVVLSGIVLTFAPDRTLLGQQDPLISNLGFLVNRNDHPALHFVASSFDALSVYHAYLIALGLYTVSRQTSYRRIIALVVLLWAVYVSLIATVKGLVW